MTAAEEHGPQTDQSMDDILASIRRIMLDEQARLKDGPTPEAPGGMQPAPAPFVMPVVPTASSVLTDSVLLLDDSMAVDALTLAPVFMPMTGNLAAVEPSVDHALPVLADLGPVVDETVSAGVLSPPLAAVQAAPVISLTAQQIEEMLAPTAAAAAAASVDALLRKLAEDRQALLQPAASASPSLEDVVRAELRPILKSWLDDNLPTIVDRLVRAELARLTLRHGG